MRTLLRESIVFSFKYCRVVSQMMRLFYNIYLYILLEIVKVIFAYECFCVFVTMENIYVFILISINFRERLVLHFYCFSTRYTLQGLRLTRYPSQSQTNYLFIYSFIWAYTTHP
jgi:hypothetical protein